MEPEISIKHAYESDPNGEAHTHQACGNCLPLKVRMVCDYGNHQELEREIENLKAELEAAYESRKLAVEEVIAQAAIQVVKARKPREQEMNEKKMSEG